MGRKKTSFKVSSGLLRPEHCEAIDRAVWEFLWFLDRTTKEISIEEFYRDYLKRDLPTGREGEMIGLVLGWSPVAESKISEDLGHSRRAVNRYLARLAGDEYIERTGQTGGSARFAVYRSKKWLEPMPKLHTPPMPNVGTPPTPKAGNPMPKQGNPMPKPHTLHKEVDLSGTLKGQKTARERENKSENQKSKESVPWLGECTQIKNFLAGGAPKPDCLEATERVGATKDPEGGPEK